MKKTIAYCLLLISARALTVWSDVPAQKPCNVPTDIRMIKISISNKADLPLLVSLTVPDKKNPAIGYFMKLDKGESQSITVSELQWFEKETTGGLRKEGEPSRVRQVDVIKHSFATVLTVKTQDQQQSVSQTIGTGGPFYITISQSQEGTLQISMIEKGYFTAKATPAP